MCSVYNLSSSDESNENDLPEVKLSKKGPKKTGPQKNIGESDLGKQKNLKEIPNKLTSKEMNKIYKPSECMKYMVVEMHPTLSNQWYAADILREVSATGAQVEVATDLCDPSFVMWSRKLPQQFTSNAGQAELTPAKERCSHALYVSPAEDVAKLVKSLSLTPHVTELRDMVGCKLTLVIYGVKDYLKKFKRNTGNSNGQVMNDIELEMAITDLLVSGGCDSIIVNTPNELALNIVQFTKAIAQAPLKLAKRACEEQADFYMKGDNKNCVAVDKDGNGVERLWQQMIAVLPLSSLETSRAVCAQYKTPRELFEAVSSSDCVDDIANIGVARTGVPGSKNRRVGPEFARKLHTLFSATDGDTIIL